MATATPSGWHSYFKQSSSTLAGGKAATYKRKPGFLAKGDDAGPVQTLTVAAAKAACDKLPSCGAICFRTPSSTVDPAVAQKTYFKLAACSFTADDTVRGPGLQLGTPTAVTTR